MTGVTLAAGTTVRDEYDALYLIESVRAVRAGADPAYLYRGVMVDAAGQRLRDKRGHYRRRYFGNEQVQEVLA